MRTVRRTFSAHRGKMQTRQGMKGGFDVKVRSSVKPICEKCKVIKRKGSVRTLNESKPQAQLEFSEKTAPKP